MTVILFLFMAFSVFAQSFQYRMEGSFQTIAGPGTPTTPSTVNYSVNWNETATTLQGLYKDNYFTQVGPSIVTGTVEPSERKMNVIFPEAMNRVKSILLTSIEKRNTDGSIPIKVETRDNLGTTIDNPPINFALLTTIQEGISKINTEHCDVGFGVLTGYCGLYDGTINEISDSAANRCHLLETGNPRLEIGEDAVIKLYLNYIPGTFSKTFHTIGSLPLSPESNNININSHYCADLPGTTFPLGDCHALNLSGEFRLEGGQTPRFTGTYTIVDDVTGESCSYGLTLKREER
jgi:hypothetical protein